jgi:DHA1 family inner membrane transport protein
VARLRSLGDPRAVVFACLFASQTALLVLSPTLVAVAHDLGVSTATAGQLRSISGATGGVTALVLATSARRAGLRTLLSAGAGLVAAGSGLSAAAPSFVVLATAQVVVGVGVSLLVAAGIAAAGEWTDPAERPHVLAWAIAGMPAAWIAGMPLVAALVDAGWRTVWLAVPGAAALLALALVRMRPSDAPRAPSRGAVRARRRPAVARFAAAELLANAAWTAVLTYSGALLLESYAIPATLVALGLGLMATAMLPGTFTARRRAATPGLLAGITAVQAVVVLALCLLRFGPALTVAVLAAMAFVNGRRSVTASAVGMDHAPDDRLAAMSLRAAANQLGYLLGAAAGGLALALGGFPALGVILAGLFVAAAVIHAPTGRTTEPAPPVARLAFGGGPHVAAAPVPAGSPAMSLPLQHLETSFDLVAPHGDRLVDTFYARLFATAPAVEPLFAGTDLPRQKQMLLATLVLLRKSLRDLDRIVPKLRELGARHVAYGAEAAHYPVVGAVLIASMAEVAGDAWRTEYSRAWEAAFGVIANAMLEGAAAAELAQAA